MLRFLVDEPHPLLRQLFCERLAAAGCEVSSPGERHTIDAAPFLHDEAGLLNEEELQEAEAALVEDGIYPSLDRIDQVSSILGEDREAVLRAAIKYGWAIAFAQHAGSQSCEWSVQDGTVPTTAVEHRFIVHELREREVTVQAMSLRTPGRLEPAIAYEGEAATFLVWLETHAGIPGPALIFTHMEEKWDLLPALARFAPEGEAVLSRVAWLESLRVVARRDAELFRQVLSAAQEEFVLAKSPRISATGEDDIRSLPQVEDAALEATFVDDFRGRQLLYTAGDCLVEDARIAAALEKHRDEITAQLGTLAARYAAALHT